MPFISEGVVSRVKANPAVTGQVGFYPGVHSGTGDAFRATSLLTEIATDIATGDTQFAHQRNHNMCKILADSLAQTQRLVNRRIDARRLDSVIKGTVDRIVQFAQEGQGIVAS